MRALFIPQVGESCVVMHDTWDNEVIEELLDSLDIVSYRWPHPPPGRSYSVFHPARDHIGPSMSSSLVMRRPTVVLSTGPHGVVSMTTLDMTYLAAMMALEEKLLALPARKEK